MKVILFGFRCSSSITGCAILVEKLICLRFPNEKEWKNGIYFYVPVANIQASVLHFVCKCVNVLSLFHHSILSPATFFTSLFPLKQAFCSNSEKRPCEGFLEPNPVPDKNRMLFSHWGKATTNSTVNPALLVFTDLTPRSCVSCESLSPCKDQKYCLLSFPS